MSIQKKDYRGWPNSYYLSNGEIELVVTGDVGPRIIHIGFIGGQNMFYELEEQLGKSGGDEFRLYGGHRIWVGPERLEVSWISDNAAPEITLGENSIRAVAPVESQTGLRKEIEVEMARWVPRWWFATGSRTPTNGPSSSRLGP